MHKTPRQQVGDRIDIAFRYFTEFWPGREQHCLPMDVKDHREADSIHNSTLSCIV
jgi:hypothetical protein